MAVVHRCVACLQSFPLLAPAFCSCGSTAFTMLHEGEDTGPATAPEGGRAADVLEGESAAGNDSPTGPASAAGGDAFECSQNGCEETATHRYTWPGRPEQLACPAHARQAQSVASHMGWELQIVALPTVVSEVAEALADPVGYAYRKATELVRGGAAICVAVAGGENLMCGAPAKHAVDGTPLCDACLVELVKAGIVAEVEGRWRWQGVPPLRDDLAADAVADGDHARLVEVQGADEAGREDVKLV